MHDGGLGALGWELRLSSCAAISLKFDSASTCVKLLAHDYNVARMSHQGSNPRAPL